MLNKISQYLYKSWIQTAGEGWTKKQVLFGYFFSVLFAAIVVGYSFFANLQWSWIQILVTAMIAWDLGGGVIGYNHKSIKIRQSKEKGRLHFFHHNLQHIHPLIIIFFYNERILLGVFIYWFITFMFYVELLEISPESGKRKLSSKGEKIVIIIEIIVAIFLVTLSFAVNGVLPEYRTFGLIAYISLPILTIILISLPITFQRTSSIVIVSLMILVSMYIKIPAGFVWLYPVYFLKLLTGFTAKEETCR